MTSAVNCAEKKHFAGTLVEVVLRQLTVRSLVKLNAFASENGALCIHGLENTSAAGLKPLILNKGTEPHASL